MGQRAWRHGDTKYPNHVRAVMMRVGILQIRRRHALLPRGTRRGGRSRARGRPAVKTTSEFGERQAFKGDEELETQEDAS
jgi:hypothetical protein